MVEITHLNLSQVVAEHDHAVVVSHDDVTGVDLHPSDGNRHLTCAVDTKIKQFARTCEKGEAFPGSIYLTPFPW